MPTNVDIPSLGESVSEAVLLRWLKNDGDQVAANEPLCELETDKANVDLPAPAAGVLRHAKEPGEAVHIGETIARIDEAPAGAAAAPSAPAPAAPPARTTTTPPAPIRPAPGGGVARAPAPPPAAAPLEDLRPSVRRLVEENRLDAAAIKGTGPHGQLIKEDVLRHLEARKGTNGHDGADAGEDGTEDDGPPAPPVVARSTSTIPAPSGNVAPGAAHPPQGPIVFDANGTKRVPMSKIRKRIAERLVAVQQTAAILTTFNEVDCSAILAVRSKYKDRFNEVYGVGLGIMSFFARAAVLCLREFPRLNAELEADDIIYHRYVHLGIAVSTDRGLAVPVLRDADQMSFARIESEVKRLAAATREGKLGLHELSGGTFTITNGGIFGSMLSTPILNPPQTGILGMHAIQKRPVAVGDKVEVHPMMYTALSYDHRLVDGKESVSFLVRLKEYLEDPSRLMLEI